MNKGEILAANEAFKNYFLLNTSTLNVVKIDVQKQIMKFKYNYSKIVNKKYFNELIFIDMNKIYKINLIIFI